MASSSPGPVPDPRVVEPWAGRVVRQRSGLLGKCWARRCSAGAADSDTGRWAIVRLLIASEGVAPRSEKPQGRDDPPPR